MVEWYRGYNVQRSAGYWLGSRDGTIIETHYVDSDHVTIQNLEKFCEKHCQMTWSIAYIPTKYLGITFRFFRKVSWFNSFNGSVFNQYSYIFCNVL